MNRFVFDIEANGLWDEPDTSRNATKLHCLCWYNIDTGESRSLTTPTIITDWLLNTPNLTLIGHKIITYDVPLLEKLLGIKIQARLVDTLILSWYLYPNRIKHGLEEWGEELGVQKPPIVDWHNEPVEVYVHRCEEDVKINNRLLLIMIEYLNKIYNNSGDDIARIINYLSFKGDCAREQLEVKLKLDRKKAQENLAFLEAEKERKRDILANIMPEHKIYKVKPRPKIPFKKDGTNSVHGEVWFALLKEHNLPKHHLGALKVVHKIEKGNPNSHAQLKEWLFSLGWIPTTFRYEKVEAAKEGEEGYVPMNKDTTRPIPQLAADDNSGNLCQSVINLFETQPELEHLDSYFITNHRIGILKGFLDSVDDNDMLRAEIAGLTNTLRFQHSKPIVNLPTIPKKYWELIRGVLIAPDENHVLCGSDMSSLEDNTKQHYMYFFDPDYVRVLRTPGFDPHIYMAFNAKACSWEEAEFYKWYDKKKDGKEYNYLEPPTSTDRYKNHLLQEAYSFGVLISLPEDIQTKIIKAMKPIRLKNKKVNFAAVYGAGPAKLALTANISLSQASELHRVYWNVNKAVKLVAEHAIHKTINGQMWLYNPVSRFWYSLRYEKDKFSTLNQGTGVYCFDTWIKYVRSSGIKIAMQYHDEKVSPTLIGKEDEVRAKLTKAIELTNEEVKLNVKLGISIDFGRTYADIH
jgi:hypothetical protein